MDSRREENRRIISPEMPLISKPWPSSRAVHSRPNRSGEGFFEVLGDDRGDRADVLVVAQGVRGPPLPVGAGPGDVGDLGVDVQLHVAVAGGVLQPVRDRQVGFVPLAGLPAVDPGVVGAGAGVAGLPLEVAEPGVDGLPDHLVDLGDQGGPVLRRLRGRRPGGPGGRSRRGRRGRSRCLGQREGQVEEQRALPGLPDGLGAAARACVRRWRAARRPAARRRGRRLCGRRPAAGPAGCRRGLCARRTAGRTVRARPSGRARSRAPWRRGPTSGRAALRRSRWPGCSSWPRPWPGRGRLASRCSQGRSPCSASRQPPTATSASAGAAELTMIIRWCMGVTARKDHESRVAKRAIKIRNERWLKRIVPLPTDRAVLCQRI